MLDISAKLQAALKRALNKVFPIENRSVKTCSILSSADLVPASKPEFGDFQINCALALAKEIKQPPRHIAKLIIDSLLTDEEFLKICNTPIIAGPGFINLTINPKTLISEIYIRLNDERLGVPQKKFSTSMKEEEEEEEEENQSSSLFILIRERKGGG